MPTVRRCCIVGCMSNSRLNPNLQFFQFPRPDNPFYKLWTQACQASLSRILPFKKPVLCAYHFHPHCIGGRRLTSSAIPSLKLEVPTNLKAVEQKAMVEEIERSRKCAYINAVVYEWLVRANLNPQLRGSITHGMIKEKAETAKQVIGCDTFMADNRWLNRFRESHLAGFAQKLASNQLKPMGPSLWIPDIVQDLQHHFPPTSADRMENFENVPEQYVNYMKQYGEYEEDDDAESDQNSSNAYPNQDVYPDQKMSSQSYYEQHHGPPQGYYQPPHPSQHHQSAAPPLHMPPHHQIPPHHQMPAQHQMPPHPLQAPPPHPSGYNPYSHPDSGYNAYQDYYSQRHQQIYQHPQPMHNVPYGAQMQSLPHHQTPPPQQQPPMRPMSHSPPQQPPTRPMSHSPMQPMSHSPVQPMSHSPAQPTSHSPPQQVQPARPFSHSPPQIVASPVDPLQIERTVSPTVANANKRRYSDEQNDNGSLPDSKRVSPALNGTSESHSPIREVIKTPETNKNDSFKIKLPPMNGNSKGPSTPTPSSHSNGTNNNSRSNSPKSETNKCIASTQNGNTGTNSSSSPTPSSSAEIDIKELETYAQALEYLKPLEDFALFKENFRAIGLISQLENILKKGNRHVVREKATN